MVHFLHMHLLVISVPVPGVGFGLGLKIVLQDTRLQIQKQFVGVPLLKCFKHNKNSYSPSLNTCNGVCSTFLNTVENAVEE